MQVFESIEMSSPGAFGGWEQIREEHNIVRWVAGVDAVIVDWGREGTVATQTEVLADNLVFVGCE